MPSKSPWPAAGRIAGVVPAAGSSSRLGTNKLLVEWQGEPLVRLAARRALAAALDPVVVVLGFETDRVRAALQGLPIETAINARHAEGMPGSLRAGLAAVPADCAAAVVLLPDMPLVTVAMLTELTARFRDTGAPLVLSLYGGTQAPPTLYARRLFPALLAASEGGRQVVRQYRTEAVEVHRPAELLVDVDLPADLARLRRLDSTSS